MPLPSFAGDSPLRWVPQAVSANYGQPLDIDIVLNEVLKDQDHVYVEYSSGPLAYQARLAATEDWAAARVSKVTLQLRG